MAEHRTYVAQARLERLITQVAVAINARALYGPGHPGLVPAIRDVTEALHAVCEDRRQDSVTFLLLGDQLFVDDRPLAGGGLYQRPFIRILRRRGIERLTLARDVEPIECHRLIEALAAGEVPRSTAHVVVGQVEVHLPDEDGPETVAGADVDAARDAFLRFRGERQASLEKLDELLWGFIDALARSTRGMLAAVPVKTHDEYTFVHSVNVSLLVLAQARSFGIGGEMLHEIGLAAVLHDVGKLSIPLVILTKPGRLEDEEWRVMQTHAELGARQLAGLDTSSPLPILVAYEHHLRFDGNPSYPVLETPRRPTFASQMTSIADVFDALCTVRPYKKAFARKAAVELLRSRAGTFHDPFLVGNFFRLLDEHAQRGR